MKFHLTWLGAVALAAVAFGVHEAGAQYAPYRPQQQPVPQVAGYPTTAQPAATPVVMPVAPATAAPAATNYQVPVATAPAAAPYAQAVAARPTQVPAYSYPQTTYPQAAYPQATYPQTAQLPAAAATSGYPTYPSVAQQPTPVESEPSVTPPAPSHSMPAPSAAPSAGQPVNGSNGYASTGYQTGSGYSGYGQNACGYTDYGIAGACDQECGGHRWFGGVYWLFMERDNPNTRKLTVRVDHNTATDPYYPQSNITVLDTDRTDFDFRSGMEVRFGSTFSIGSACDEGCGNGYGYGNACGCGPAQDNFAWEVAWWGLDEDNQSQTYWDQDPLNNIRLYGMVNFAGLEYNDGTTWRPVNEYYGYGLPIDDPGMPPAQGYISVFAQRTRSYFSAQNLELNFIRFPVCNVGCGGCNSGCNSGCNGGCGSGYGACGCESDCTPITFSMCGMCGVRYFRIDDDFYYGSQWAMWDTGAYTPGGWINYDLSVDNNLIGPQVGWNMNYCVGCKWNFFCNSTFGVFNNHIEARQRVWGDNGESQYAQTGGRMNSRSNKDDVSFLGELRVGGAYDITCNWRGVLAYRALAITGIANSVDQIPTDFSNAQYPGMIDSDASIIIHGVQAGVECQY